MGLQGDIEPLLEKKVNEGMTVNKGLDYYLSLNYTLDIKKVEDYYYANITELPGCQTTADTLEQVMKDIEQVKRDYIEIKIEYGDLIPEPEDK